MPTLNAFLWILVFTLLGGLVSAGVAGTFLLVSETRRAHALPYLVAFATGALLGAALLGLLPEAIEHSGRDYRVVCLSLLGGIALFFILEKLVLWRHCHEDHCETHDVVTTGHRDHTSALMMVVGESMHNALDGVLIAASFLTDVHLGIMAALAVMAHEIPSEVGNFAVLLHGGMSRMRAFAFNVGVSLTAIIGGLAGYFALSHALSALPVALGVSAASLLYVAVADLIPGLHRRVDPRASLWQVVLMGLGVGAIVTVQRLVPH